MKERKKNVLVDNLATISTNVTALNASVLSPAAHICNIVPLAAAPVPDANGSMPETKYICHP